MKYTAECHHHTVKDLYRNRKWWHIQREQQWTQNGSLRNAELANHCLGSTATNRDELGSVTQVWAEPLHCTAGYAKNKIKSRFQISHFNFITLNSLLRLIIDVMCSTSSCFYLDPRIYYYYNLCKCFSDDPKNELMYIPPSVPGTLVCPPGFEALLDAGQLVVHMGNLRHDYS